MASRLSKLSPWNWLKKEEEQARVPVACEPRDALASGLRSVQRDIDRIFDDFFRGTMLPGFPAWGPEAGSAISGWFRPSLDIEESDKEYTVTVELPGVDRDDVEVELTADTLRIRGEKREEREENGKNRHSVERVYGSFQRVLSLPGDVDADRAEASFKNGVMTIRIPRHESARRKTKRIAVKSD